MAQLIVRNLDDSLVKALKLRAAHNRRSAEAEHREILRAALTDNRRGDLKAHLLRMPDQGEDRDFEVQRPRARRVNL
jgi:plasmid stability protein